MSRIVVDSDYHHGQTDDVWVWLSPGLRHCLAHRIGDRKIVLSETLAAARLELTKAIEEIDDLLENEVDKT